MFRERVRVQIHPPRSLHVVTNELARLRYSHRCRRSEAREHLEDLAVTSYHSSALACSSSINQLKNKYHMPSIKALTLVSPLDTDRSMTGTSHPSTGLPDLGLVLTTAPTRRLPQ